LIFRPNRATTVRECAKNALSPKNNDIFKLNAFLAVMLSAAKHLALAEDFARLRV